MATTPVDSATQAVRTMPSRAYMLLSFFAIYVVWGTTYLAIRYAVESIPPLLTAGFRHTAAGLVLFAVAWSRGYRPRRLDLLNGAILGFLFFFIGHGSLHWAEQYVSSGLAALLVASEPIWILLIGAALGQEGINWLNGAGLLCGLAGVVILTGGVGHGGHLWAAIAVLVGAASWALGVCISPRLALPRDILGRAAIPLIWGACFLLAAAAVSGEFSALHRTAISQRSLLALGYLVVFGSIVAFTAYNWLLQHYSATLVATHTFVNPLVAVLVGWLWAGEALNARVAFATAAILAAIVLIQRGDRHAELQAEAAQSD